MNNLLTHLSINAYFCIWQCLFIQKTYAEKELVTYAVPGRICRDKVVWCGALLHPYIGRIDPLQKTIHQVQPSLNRVQERSIIRVGDISVAKFIDRDMQKLAGPGAECEMDLPRLLPKQKASASIDGRGKSIREMVSDGVDSHVSGRCRRHGSVCANNSVCCSKRFLFSLKYVTDNGQNSETLGGQTCRRRQDFRTISMSWKKEYDRWLLPLSVQKILPRRNQEEDAIEHRSPHQHKEIIWRGWYCLVFRKLRILWTGSAVIQQPVIIVATLWNKVRSVTEKGSRQ